MLTIQVLYGIDGDSLSAKASMTEVFDCIQVTYLLLLFCGCACVVGLGAVRPALVSVGLELWGSSCRYYILLARHSMRPARKILCFCCA
jgi:hypothetical protein